MQGKCNPIPMYVMLPVHIDARPCFSGLIPEITAGNAVIVIMNTKRTAKANRQI